MGGPARWALALGPLAAYFGTLGWWQGGKRPRVVAGPVDYGFLAFGLGGLIAFGPVGQAVVEGMFPTPTPWAWGTVASFVALMAMLGAARTGRRLVVYHVEPEELRRSVANALHGIDGTFEPSLSGFEDHKAARGVKIEAGSRLRPSVVEGYGRDPEALIADLAPALRARLREVSGHPSPLAAAWFALAGLTAIVPIVVGLLARSEVRMALRALLNRLQGG